jgi:heavy metal sensor kinase
LTLWFAGLLAAIVLLLGAALYLGLRYRLHANFDEQLRNQAAVTLAAVQIGEDGAPVLAGAPREEDDADYFVRLLDADGEILLDTGFDEELVPLDRAAVANALAGNRRYDTVIADDEALRVLTLPVRDGDRAVGALQIGLDRADLDETLGELFRALLLAIPVALVVAAAVGYVVAGRALAPVATITALAARIGGRDLGARLNLALPDDELGRLARTFDGMLARIEDAFERQRRFTGDAAHELRTPLSLMRSRLDVTLARRRSPEEYEAAMLELGTDLERMTGLVGALLMLARADTGRLVAERAPLDLRDPTRFVAEQFRPLAGESGVSLTDRTEPALVVADHDLIVQVLVNLVTNALAHTPAGGTIELGCRTEGDRALLWVADSGVGIAPEHQARVFDRFYRGDTGRTRARGGSGLGLAICKAIAEAHGGEIGLQSAPGQGTTVELRLPSTPRSRARTGDVAPAEPVDGAVHPRERVS